jgi:hypothetical protein
MLIGQVLYYKLMKQDNEKVHVIPHSFQAGRPPGDAEINSSSRAPEPQAVILSSFRDPLSHRRADHQGMLK